MANVQPDKFTKIASELLDALCRTNMTAYESRVFMAIMRMTYGWHKKAVKISQADIVALTGIKKSHVSRAISSLTNKNMITRNGVTGIQKDYDLWKLPNEGLPLMRGTPNEGQGGAPNEGHLGTPNEGHPLLVKDNERKKLKITGVDKPLQPHQAFVEAWKAVYTERTGSPFKISKLDFIQAAGLIKDYGLDECMGKAGVLADLCAEGARWPAKNGWADFTISNLVRNWNSIINQVRISDQEMKDQKFLKKLEEERKRDERIGQLIGSAR
jgi:phage replication O-like protein O